MTQPPSQTQTPPVRYLHALRRHWKFILALAVLSVATAVIATAATTKRYDATADLLIRPLSANDATYQGFSSVFQQPLDASSIVATAARVIASGAVKQPCLQAQPRAAASASVAIQPVSGADVVGITASSPSGSIASLAANSFADCVIANRDAAFHAELQARVKDLRARSAAVPRDARQGNFEYAALQQQLAAFVANLGAPNPTVSLLTRAATPTAPSWPRPKLAIAVSLLVGLLLGVAVAFLLEFVTPRIADEDELRAAQRLPILARIPRLPRGVAAAYLAGQKPLPAPVWRSYRVLRAVLTNAGVSGGYPKTIVVTSAMPGDGKSTTAINLALTLARSELRVILVDFDAHRPMVSSFFNLPTSRGGVNRLVRGASPGEVLVDAPLDANLKLVLAAADSSAYVGLTVDRAKTIMDSLAGAADVVVIDCPPIAEVAEVLDIAAAAEAVLLVVRLGRTRRDRLTEAREMLASRGVSPAGFVVTTREGVERETHYDYPADPPAERLAPISAAPPAKPNPEARRASSGGRRGRR